jgi:23S rRNA-/tRNA-specific pseudouridylate synthase
LTDEVEAVALVERAAAAWRPAILGRFGRVVAADKPAVLPTHAQGGGETSLLAAVRTAEGDEALQPAHRLDVGTSGPVLFASGGDLRALGRAFETGAVHKEYWALVKGVPHKSGCVRGEGGAAGHGPEETRYRRERVVGGYGLVRVFPVTGRRHQIRRHLRRIGHPILGDERYGDPRVNRFLAETCALVRTFLHLAVIEAQGPDGTTMRLETPLPAELELVLERLTALREKRVGSGKDPESPAADGGTSVPDPSVTDL